MLSTVQQPKAVNKKTWLSLCYINFKTMQWTVTINSAQSYLNMHVYKSTGSLGPSGPRLLGGTSGLLTSSFAPFDIWGIVHSSSWIDRKIPRCSGVPRTRTNINFEFGNILKFTILVFFGHLLWVCWWRLLVPLFDYVHSIQPNKIVIHPGQMSLYYAYTPPYVLILHQFWNLYFSFSWMFIEGREDSWC